MVLEAAAYRKAASVARAELRALPYASRAVRTPGDPVLLVPGFLAGDYTLGWMAKHLRARGHRTYRTWMLANVGCQDRGTQGLEARIEAIG